MRGQQAYILLVSIDIWWQLERGFKDILDLGEQVRSQLEQALAHHSLVDVRIRAACRWTGQKAFLVSNHGSLEGV